MHDRDLETPQFVLFALARPCALRTEEEDWTSPERAERRLRSLRELSLANAEGREQDGICVEQSRAAALNEEELRGFRAAEILTVYGGLPAVLAQCASCPACAVQIDGGYPIAGCFGWLINDAASNSAQAALEQAISELGLEEPVRRAFLATRPTWYGLWANSPLNAEQLEIHQQIAERAAQTHHTPNSLAPWLASIRAAVKNALPLYVQLGPAGQIQGRKWRVPAHCSRCKAEWPGTRQHCTVCGQVGHSVPSRWRNARGHRPYMPLANFLGTAGAQSLADKYKAKQLPEKSIASDQRG